MSQGYRERHRPAPSVSSCVSSSSQENESRALLRVSEQRSEAPSLCPALQDHPKARRWLLPEVGGEAAPAGD